MKEKETHTSVFPRPAEAKEKKKQKQNAKNIIVMVRILTSIMLVVKLYGLQLIPQSNQEHDAEVTDKHK